MAGMIRTLLLAALGGALGSAARMGMASVMPWPWATLAVNAVGGLLMGLLAATLTPGSGAALLLMAGVLGGFTTFSAFSLDTLRLVEAGRAPVALVYVGFSVGLALLACWAGLLLGRAA